MEWLVNVSQHGTCMLKIIYVYIRHRCIYAYEHFIFCVNRRIYMYIFNTLAYYLTFWYSYLFTTRHSSQLMTSQWLADMPRCYIVIGYNKICSWIKSSMSWSEPSIKRVWPTSQFARSRLRRAVTSQLGTQGCHVCCHTGVVWHEVCKCKLMTICVHLAASPFHDYLRMLVMMRWPHSPLSPGYVTTDRTVFVSPVATSLRLRTE